MLTVYYNFFEYFIGHPSQNKKLKLIYFKIDTITTTTTTTTLTTTTSTTSSTTTCKKIEETRCFWDSGVGIKFITGQTAESCLNSCMEIEDCKNFMLYSSGTCFLLRVDVNE